MSLLYFLQILIKLWLSFPAMSWLYGSWIQALLQVLRAWKGMWIHHLIGWNEYMLHSNILKPRADISTWKFKIIFNFQVLLSTLGFSILYFQASLAINFYIFLYHCDSSVPYVNKSIILLFIWTVFFFFSFWFQLRCSRCQGSGLVEGMEKREQCTICHGMGSKR